MNIADSVSAVFAHLQWWDLVFGALAVMIGTIFWKTVKDLPIHPDSAEFLYPGLVRALRQNFKPYRVLMGRRWWTGTILQIFERWRLIPFPPNLYCELDSGQPIIEGGHPVIQQKMAIYYFFQNVGRFFRNRSNIFRLVNSFFIIAIGLLSYLILIEYTHPWINIVASLLLLLVLTLPFFDTYQIHAELYGSAVLILVLWLIIPGDLLRMECQAWLRLISGIMLVVLAVFVKITFATDAFLFMFFPFFIEPRNMEFSVLGGEVLGIVLILGVFSFTPYFLKLLHILNPFTLMKYRKSVLSMQNADNIGEMPKIDSKNKGRISNWLYFNMHNMFCPLIGVFLISSICIGLFLDISPFSVYGFLVILAVSSLVVIKRQNKLYAAHFIPGVIPLTLLWAITATEAINRLMVSQIYTSWEYSGVLGILLLLLIPPVFIMWAFLCYVLKSRPSEYFLTTYLKRKNPHILQLLVAGEIGKYIKHRTSEQDRIFCFGYASSVYLYAHRRAALEFLEGSLGIDPEISNSVCGSSWRWWVCRDIHKFKPRYIVDMDGRLNVQAINKSTGLGYRMERKFYGCFPVYVLKSSSSCKPRFGDADVINNLVLNSSLEFERRELFNMRVFQARDKEFSHLHGELKTLVDSWRNSVDKLKIS